MLTPICYPNDGRRYIRVGQQLPVSFLERLQRYPPHALVSNTRPIIKTMNEREPDSDTTPPRKRIAVACTRCRKRKIRCSGDPGNGEPCHNCKNAGAEPCQFLRVASQETTIIQPDRGFGYDMDTARTYQVRGGMPSPFSPHYPPELAEGLVRYAPAPAAYNAPGRYHQTLPSWGAGYCDETPDYSNLGYQQPYYNQEQAYVYRMACAAGRSEANSVMYGDGSPNYNYTHRPPVSSSDSPNFSLTSVATSLPSSNDRLLPTPVNRTLASSGAPVYRAEESSPYNFKPQNAATTLPSPVVSPSEASGGYLSCENSPAPGFPPSSGVSSINGSGSSSSDSRMSMSTHCGTDGSSNSSSIFSASGMRTPSSSSDLSYDYGDPTRKRAGTPLSNGQMYKVPHHPPPSVPSQPVGQQTVHDLHDHQSALSAAAYLMSGVVSSDADTAGGPGTTLSGATAANSGVGGAGAGSTSGSGSGATGHADIQRRTPAGRRPAAP
ncbi:hypothetical protein ACHAQA_006715 [Verticillium albo-atrum]